MGSSGGELEITSDWLLAFHAGERRALEQCYRAHFGRVHVTVGRILRGADHDTVVHEVFYKLISDAQVRHKFAGGDLGAWLAVVARNLAIDHARRRGREHLVEPAHIAELAPAANASVEQAAELELFADRFCRKILPAKWLPVFEARFVKQLSQRDAASLLGLHRTTLVYQEMRIRSLLRRHLRTRDDAP